MRYTRVCRQINLASHLIVNPLKIENTHLIRESKTTFPVPKFVSFDLFGTVYFLKEPVSRLYHEIGKQFGVMRSPESIGSRFRDVYAQLNQTYPNYGKTSNHEITNATDWWKQLVVDVFEIDHFRDSSHSNDLCEYLLQHFTTGDAYEVFPDVIPTLEKLKSQGIRLIGSTNSDDRVFELLQNLGIASYFDHIYTSYELGHCKPDRQFFMEIVKQFHPVNDKLHLFLENCWHVGNDYNQDFLGAVKAGWNGVFVDRTRTSEFFTAKDKLQIQNDNECFMSGGTTNDNPDMIVIANNRIVVDSLNQLQGLFKD